MDRLYILAFTPQSPRVRHHNPRELARDSTVNSHPSTSRTRSPKARGSTPCRPNTKSASTSPTSPRSTGPHFPSMTTISHVRYASRPTVSTRWASQSRIGPLVHQEGRAIPNASSRSVCDPRRSARPANTFSDGSVSRSISEVEGHGAQSARFAGRNGFRT